MRAVALPLFAVVLASTACRSGNAQSEAGAPAESPSATPVARRENRVKVEVAEIQPSSANLEFVFPGEVEGSRDALLASPAGGLVEAVLVAEGATVKKGEALVRVDTSIQVARRDQAQADYEQAKLDLQRTQAMGEAVARAQSDAARTRLRISEAQLKLANAQVARSVISSPFDGVVAQLDLEVGEVTAPGAPIARVVQISPVTVGVSVADRDVGALKVGMAVQVTTDALPEVLPGRITFVSPAGDLRTRAFRAKVEVPNPGGKLLPGMIARVRVNATAAQESLVLPQHVIVTRAREVGVYVAEEGVAKWRPLKLGNVVGQQVVVTSGIERGEKLVVTGHRELVEGDKLQAVRDGVCCTRGRVVFPGSEATR